MHERTNDVQDQDQVLGELKKQKQLADEYQRESNEASTQASYFANWSSDAKQVGSCTTPVPWAPS